MEDLYAYNMYIKIKKFTEKVTNTKQGYGCQFYQLDIDLRESSKVLFPKGELVAYKDKENKNTLHLIILERFSKNFISFLKIKLSDEKLLLMLCEKINEQKF